MAFHVSILAPDKAFRDSIRDSVTRHLLELWPGTNIDFPVDDFSGHPKRLYLLLFAESSNGYRLGRDWLYDDKINSEKPMKTIQFLVR